MSEKVNSGDACEADNCRGVLSVYCTIVDRELSERRRYLACNKCGWRPENNIIIVPLEFAPSQKAFRK